MPSSRSALIVAADAYQDPSLSRLRAWIEGNPAGSTPRPFIPSLSSPQDTIYRFEFPGAWAEGTVNIVEISAPIRICIQARNGDVRFRNELNLELKDESGQLLPGSDSKVHFSLGPGGDWQTWCIPAQSLTRSPTRISSLAISDGPLPFAPGGFEIRSVTVAKVQ